MVIVYCKSHKRRPIRFGRDLPMRDAQAQIPAGWCERCGREIFARNERLCPWCLEQRGVL